VTAVGANPVALTDCLCFGNPEKPEQMGEFVDAVRGIVDACAVIKLKDYPDSSLPVIAGNVSLYNESAKGSIPPSPMISCLGVLPDVHAAVTYDLKQSNSLLVLIGQRKNECGGGVYYQLANELGSNLPKPDLSLLNQEISAVSTAIQNGMVLAAHAISNGGIAVALAQMSFKHKIGLQVSLKGDLPIDKRLFSESGGFVLEIAPMQQSSFHNVMTTAKVPYEIIGETMKEPVLEMNSVVHLSISEAKTVWENGLRERLV
jgi:phosphoribosylformylglycinamidine synthase